jgi:hypothetical protein
MPFVGVFLQRPEARHLSRDVPANANFLCDKVTVIGDTIKGGTYSTAILPNAYIRILAFVQC